LNMNKMIRTAFLLMGSIRAATACDLCSIYSAQEAQGGGRGWFAGVAEQFTHFGTLQNDGQREPAHGEYINRSISQFCAGYSFTARFGLQFNLPVIDRRYGSATARGHDFGAGDASVIGNAVLYQRSGDRFAFHWTALAGVKFPTGDAAWLGRPDF